MKRLIIYHSLFILLFTATFLSKLQAQNFEWGKFLHTIDDYASKEIIDMDRDDNGNVYVFLSYRIIDLSEKTIEENNLNHTSQSSTRIDQLQTGV